MSITNYGFAYINDVAIPYPSYSSGLQSVSTMVNSARTADGVVRGEIVGRNVSKVELKWSCLTPAEWSSILQAMNGFYFNFRYIDMLTNDWVTRKFYCGDRSAEPFMVDKTTNKPKYWVNCKVNVIDVGE